MKSQITKIRNNLSSVISWVVATVLLPITLILLFVWSFSMPGDFGIIIFSACFSLALVIASVIAFISLVAAFIRSEKFRFSTIPLGILSVLGILYYGILPHFITYAPEYPDYLGSHELYTLDGPHIPKSEKPEMVIDFSNLKSGRHDLNEGFFVLPFEASERD